MKCLDLAHIARTDLDAIRRYSVRTWGEPQTALGFKAQPAKAD